VCDVCEWETRLEEIQLAIDEAWELPERAEVFANGVIERLESIATWIDDHGHITPAQVKAVQNMSAAIEKWQR
jgi:hypothetical protein